MKIFKYIIPLICIIGATTNCSCGKNKHKEDELIIEPFKDTDFLSKEFRTLYEKFCTDWETSTPIQQKRIEDNIKNIIVMISQNTDNYMNEFMKKNKNIFNGAKPSEKQKEEIYNKIMNPLLQEYSEFYKKLPDKIILDGSNKTQIIQGLELVKVMLKTKIES